MSNENSTVDTLHCPVNKILESSVCATTYCTVRNTVYCTEDDAGCCNPTRGQVVQLHQRWASARHVRRIVSHTPQMSPEHVFGPT